jgi:hypothetical protein
MAFKCWRCQARPPIPGYYLSYMAAAACIRKGEHHGPHRNRLVEWDQNLKSADITDLRLRKRFGVDEAAQEGEP